MNTETKTGRKSYHMNTTKTEKGFSFIVREFTETKKPQPNGQYGTWKTVKEGHGYKTRARATSAGVKWKMHLKRIA